jgi:hypothetical protein
MDSVTRFFAYGFFHKSVSLQPQSIPLGPLQIFCENLQRYSQVKEHHRYQQHPRTPPVSMTPTANFATTSVVDTGGKFASSVNDTGDKFSAGVNNTSGYLPLVSMTPVANLPCQ